MWRPSLEGVMMSSLIRVYRVREFIRVNETGVLDVERSKRLIPSDAAVALSS
jgi:hypothetical protein